MAEAEANCHCRMSITASKGCMRISASLNRFIDHMGSSIRSMSVRSRQASRSGPLARPGADATVRTLSLWWSTPDEIGDRSGRRGLGPVRLLRVGACVVAARRQARLLGEVGERGAVDSRKPMSWSSCRTFRNSPVSR